MNEINIPNNIDLVGFKLLGRGPKATGGSGGWSTSDELYFMCANCGSMMWSKTKEYYRCQCGAMSVDHDACRFGSSFGDENIVVFKKM